MADDSKILKNMGLLEDKYSGSATPNEIEASDRKSDTCRGGLRRLFFTPLMLAAWTVTFTRYNLGWKRWQWLSAAAGTALVLSEVAILRKCRPLDAEVERLRMLSRLDKVLERRDALRPKHEAPSS